MSDDVHPFSAWRCPNDLAWNCGANCVKCGLNWQQAEIMVDEIEKSEIERLRMALEILANQDNYEYGDIFAFLPDGTPAWHPWDYARMILKKP
jgi:hypothetical protein